VALEQFKTQVLLLHSEQSTLDALSSGFNDRYELHCATSGVEALNTLGETPVDIIVSAQDLPGMSGLDALREAKKRSPKTLTILLAGNDRSDGLEAQVSEKELYQVVRGALTPDRLLEIIEEATRSVQLAALSVSANDTSANVDTAADELSLAETGSSLAMTTGQHRALDDLESTGQLKALAARKATAPSGNPVDILVLTQDEEFLKTIRASSEKAHTVYHAPRPGDAEKLIGKHSVGVLVTDAALASENIEALTQRLRKRQPRLVAIVAGRRDDGETPMDLINRGTVYRFLLKPVSPGRARLAIEASARHHLDAPDSAFKGKAGPKKAKPKAKPATPVATNNSRRKTAPTAPKPAKAAAPAAVPAAAPPSEKPAAPPPEPISTPGLDGAMDQGKSFTETVTDLAATVARSLAKGAGSYLPGNGKPKIVIPPEGSVPVREFPYDDSPDEPESPNYLLFGAIGAVVLVAIAAGLFFALGGDEEDPAVAVESVAEPAEPTAMRLPGTEAMVLLTKARTARTNGNLYSPAGRNAAEYYIEARDTEPDNEEIQAEIAAIIDEVFASAEESLVDGRTIQASRALRVIELADPGNNRLAFMNTQLRELELRNALEDVRAAIAQERFEDAGRLLRSAEDYVDGVSPELEAMSLQLATARSDQQLDEVLDLAGQRLAENQLIAPSSDNARYYYELALAVDPESAAAAQGLLTVASRLALRARAAIDSGDVDAAEPDAVAAQSIDPDSPEVRAILDTLEQAKSAGADTPRASAVPASPTPRAAAPARTTPPPAARQQEAAPADAAASSTSPPAQTPASASTSAAAGMVPPAATSQRADTPATAAALPAAEASAPATAEAPAEQPSAVPETVAISALKRTKYVPPS